MKTAKNDITGDVIASKGGSDAYRQGWDRIFGKKKETPPGEQLELWPEDRVDIIGQNGNDGLHYGVTPKVFLRGEEDDGQVE